jgi:hypothetical protein
MSKTTVTNLFSSLKRALRVKLLHRPPAGSVSLLMAWSTTSASSVCWRTWKMLKTVCPVRRWRPGDGYG